MSTEQGQEKKYTKSIKQNVTCHFCRANTFSLKNGKSRGRNYCKKDSCRLVFCDECLQEHIQKIDPCLVCRNDCCCCYESCQKAHTHCFTYKRTEKRHAAKSTPKKKKLNNQANAKRADDKEEELLPPMFQREASETFELPLVDDNDRFSLPCMMFCLDPYEAEELFQLLGSYLKKWP